jgi:endonuclease YncB( thermonuclease family)
VAGKQFQLWVQLVRWVDGDTFTGVCDLSCRIYLGRLDKPIRFRAALIDAPELPTPEGLAALEYAKSIAPPGEFAAISTGLDEYARPLLDLLTERGRFSDVMLGSGHAQLYRR